MYLDNIYYLCIFLFNYQTLIIFIYLFVRKQIMSDFYMYSQNRFISGNPLQNRTQYAFEMASSTHHRQFHEMKSQMPSDVLELFKANQIGFLKAPVKKKCRPLDPVSSLGMNLTEMFALPNLQLIEQEKRETRAQRIQRIARQKANNNESNINKKIQQWNPFQLPHVISQPQKTLFVGRLNYKTTQKQLKHEFERYGIVKSVQIVRDQQNNSRGYAFVQFQNKQDYNHAYKNANQRKISGRRIIVDYERGRTILNWRPRRFGGGLGELRLTKQQAKRLQENQKLKKQSKPERVSKSRSRSRDKKQRRHQDERDRDRDRQRQRQRRDHKKDKKQKKDKKDRRDRRQYS